MVDSRAAGGSRCAALLAVVRQGGLVQVGEVEGADGEAVLGAVACSVGVLFGLVTLVLGAVRSGWGGCCAMGRIRVCRPWYVCARRSRYLCCRMPRRR